VSTTVQTEEGTKRFRKCYVCQDNFQTIESVIEYVFVGRPNESETSYLEEDG
jgi:transcriptional regulator NrdR family protein